MASHSSISRLARNIRNPDLPPWLPRPAHPVLHLGYLDDVDIGRNVVNYAWNDPSGVITQGVPYLQSYTDTHQPAAGHLVQLLQYGGGNAMILGRQVVPDGFIIVP